MGPCSTVPTTIGDEKFGQRCEAGKASHNGGHFRVTSLEASVGNFDRNSNRQGSDGK